MRFPTDPLEIALQGAIARMRAEHSADDVELFTGAGVEVLELALIEERDTAPRNTRGRCFA